MNEHNGHANRSPEEIERDIAQTRSEIEGTLGQLQQDLSQDLDAVSERASGYLRKAKKVGNVAGNIGRTARDNAMPIALVGLGMSKVTDRVGRVARENPMRLALIGAGLSWIGLSMWRRSRGTEEVYVSPEYEEEYAEEYEAGPAYEPYYGIGYVEGDGHEEGRAEQAKERLQSAKERAGERLEHTQERARDVKESAKHRLEGAKERTQDIKESAKHRLEGAKNRLSGATERAKETMSSAKNRASNVSSRARHMGSEVRYRASRASSKARERFSEQPLLIGLVGFVTGLLIGAAMPVTRREQRTLGPARNRLLSRADEMAGERIREAGERVERSVSGSESHRATETRNGAQRRDGDIGPGL